MSGKVIIITLLLVFSISFLVLKRPTSFTPDNHKNNPHEITAFLQNAKDVSLSGGANRLDYQSIDTRSKRLFISHLGSDRVHVYSLSEQAILKDIELNGSPYGILAIPNLNKVYVSIGGINQIAVIEENSLTVTKYIQVGDTPDGLTYNAQTNQIFVSNENGGTISVINATTDERVTDISIGGDVGNSHNFARQNRIYTVSSDENSLVEIDPTRNKIIKKYPLQGCTHPHGFYIDEETSTAFITCDGNNALLVFDLNNEQILSRESVGGGPDVLAYDEGLHRLYVAAESGVMTIFDVNRRTLKKLY